MNLPNPIATYVPNIRPNASWLPSGVMEFLEGAAGGILIASIAISVIALIGAAALFIVGKIGGNQNYQSKGGSALLYVIGGIIVLGAVNGLIAWALAAGSTIGA